MAASELKPRAGSPENKEEIAREGKTHNYSRAKGLRN